MSINKSIFLSLKYCLITMVLFLFAFLLLKFPENAGAGVSKGIDICVGTLVPSMFPFLFVTSFLTLSGLCQKSEKVFSAVTKKLFALPGTCGSVIIFSMLGGFPVGARMTVDLYKNGYITIEQSQRMILFCVNPGPAFVITGVGYYMLNSEKAGIILYFSVVLSSVIIGILTRFIFDKTDYIDVVSSDNGCNYTDALIKSVSDSFNGMLSICAWVILFSCVNELLKLIPMNTDIRLFLNCILEVTNGCESASDSLPLPIISGILGFAGLCVSLQLLPYISAVKLPLRYFLTFRVINACMTIIITMIILHFFPHTVETISVGSLPAHVNNNISVPVCSGVFIMCFILLLGEDYRIKKEIK